jgi:nicotinamidase-related amidase
LAGEMKNTNMNFSENIALIIIDYQKGFDNLAFWGNSRNNPNAEENGCKILEIFRRKKLPVFHVQHFSKNPDSVLHESNKGNLLKSGFEPQKNEYHIKKLVIFGLTTEHCVSTTTRMAGNFGYEVYLVEDACAAFNKKGCNGIEYSAQQIHEMEISCLNKEFAEVVSTKYILQKMDL